MVNRWKQELKAAFPHLIEEHSILTKALLPEALERIAQEVLKLSNEDMEWYMRSATSGEWMDELRQKNIRLQ